MRKLWLLFAQTVTVGLGLWFVIAALRPHWLPLPSAAPSAPAIVATAPAASPLPNAPTAAPTGSYSQAAKRAAPAVVSIVASKTARDRGPGEDAWLRFFFGNGRTSPQPRRW